MNQKTTAFTAKNMLLLTYLAGGAVALLGGVIIAAWYQHNLTVLQLNQSFVPMQYNTALAFLAGGAGLCLAAGGRLNLAALIGTISGLLGLLTMTEYVTGISLNIDQLFMRTYIMTTAKYPGRMAPSTAFCFTFLSIALWLTWRGTKVLNLSVAGLIGSLIAALGLIGTLGYFTNLPATYVWANFSSMALHTALAFIVLGMGLVANTLRTEIQMGIGSAKWRAGAVGLATFTVFVGATQAMLAGEENAFRSKAEVVAQAETNKLRTMLQLHMQAIERMAERAEIHLPGQIKWQADASRYVKHMNGIYNTIAWLDPSYQTRWKIVYESAEPISFDNISTLIDTAKQSDSVRLIQVIGSKDRSVYLIIAPIIREREREGLIVAIIDPARLFGTMQIVSDTVYDFTIKNGSETFYTSRKNKLNDIPWVQSVNGFLGDVEWQMDVWPANTSYSVAPWFVLLAGILSASALTVLVLKSQAVNARLREMLAIIDTAPIGMLVLDSTGSVRQINMEGEKLFGYTRDEIYGAEARTLIHDLLNHELTKYTDSFIAEPARCRRKDGTEVFTEIGINHILINGQEHILVVVTDISQRKQAQIAKENVLAQLQGIIGAAREFAIIETDKNGLVTLFSRGAEILLGYVTEEIVGKAHIDLFHFSEEAGHQSATNQSGFNAIVDMANQEESSSRDCTCLHKNGTHLLVNLTVATVQDQSGNITGYLSIAKDIRKEKDILQALADARDKAQSANRAKSQFLANMSHELRTPMNAILGMLQLLQHTNMTTRQLDYTTKTQSAAQALLGLLNDILDFSKVEAGKMLLENTPFRLDDLMRDLSVIFSSNVGDKEIDLLFSIDPAFPPCVSGDKMRLRQILINLAGNAIKFTESGSVIISLQVTAKDDHQSTILFSVQDTGIGIGPDQMHYVFEGFSQAEASTTRRFGGTGLGLAISQRLVALMGGNIEVESTVNVGSRFYFSLTMQHADFDQEGKPAVQHQHNQQRRVLIVDDSAEARDILYAMIQSLGWLGTVAENGAAALARLQQAEEHHVPYDLVFMDWKMPGMDGLQTATQMRQQKRSNNIPIIIIMVTAHDREILLKQLHHDQSVLDGFLVKPVTASMLFDAVVNAGRESEKIRTKLRSQRLYGMHLLVVEDNLINQEVARELLKSEGASVQVANDGQEGVDRLIAESDQFDAVLMDIQMPVMDGYEATRAIRLLPGMQSMPIIATTANAMASDKEACRAAGMNDHVSKPIDIDELVKSILRCCESGAENSSRNGVQPETEIEIEIEFDDALKRLGGNGTLYVRLVARFKTDVAELTAQFRQSINHQEADKVMLAHQAIHTLKGLAATVGATALTECAQQIETQLQSGSTIADVALRFQELESLAARSCAALDAITTRFEASQS